MRMPILWDLPQLTIAVHLSRLGLIGNCELLSDAVLAKLDPILIVKHAGMHGDRVEHYQSRKTQLEGRMAALLDGFSSITTNMYSSVRLHLM